MRKRILLILLSLCIFLCGCENGNTPDITDTSGDTVPVIVTTDITDAPEPSPYPVIINDTEITEEPKRVVCLSPAFAEIIYELGVEASLVGRSSYCHYPEEITAVPEVGRPACPDIEKIAALKPDLIITATKIPEKDKLLLQEQGIVTLYIPYPRSVTEFGNIYSALGLVFKGAFDGEAYGQEIFSPVAKALESEDKPLGDFIYVTEGMSLAGGSTLESSVLSALGNNLAADKEGYITEKDFLVENPPQVVLLNNIYDKEQLSADPVLGELDAVKSGSIILIDNSYFECPTGRITGLINELKSASADIA
ncbi:MAG: ABC transporter substrate-binding protein [Ruminiclostridium sp.]